MLVDVSQILLSKVNDAELILWLELLSSAIFLCLLILVFLISPSIYGLFAEMLLNSVSLAWECVIVHLTNQ